jgi:hypothetical protein
MRTSMFTGVFLIITFQIQSIYMQFYAAPIESNDDPTSDMQNVEQKYVNSGQSVELICDLPTNMPDGKVSYAFYL